MAIPLVLPPAMVVFVVMLNLVLALSGFYLVIWLWQLRQRLAQVSRTLTEAERHTHNTLYGAPEAIALGQTGTHNLRLQLQRSGRQLRQLQRALSLLTMVWNLGLSSSGSSRLSKPVLPQTPPVAPGRRRA